MREIIIDGLNFYDMKTFYQQFKATFIADPTFEFGNNLDAINDVLSGGFGIIEDDIYLIRWINSSKSKIDLGYGATLKYYEDKINSGEQYDTIQLLNDIKLCKIHLGPTLFDKIIKVFDEYIIDGKIILRLE